jgi:hypothetical protein
MALNSFGPRFDPQYIPSYDDWVANNSFDPFGPEPFAPTSYTNSGIPLHFRTRGESRIEEGMGMGSHVDRGHGSSEVDMTHNFPQEVSSDLPWAIAGWRLMGCVTEIPVRIRTETNRTHHRCKCEPDPSSSHSSVPRWSIAYPSPDQGRLHHYVASCWATTFPIPTRIPRQEGTHPCCPQGRAPPSDMADPLRRLRERTPWHVLSSLGAPPFDFDFSRGG